MPRTMTLAITLSLSAIFGGGFQSATPPHADTTEAWCWIRLTGADAPVPELQRCTVSQRQGNAEVRLAGREYSFPAPLDGKAYHRTADDRSLRFETQERSITIYWQDPKPYGGSPRCSMNQGLWRACRVLPLPGVKGGMEVRFTETYDAPWFRFRPAQRSPVSPDTEWMLDEQGNRWRWRGHQSLTLQEEGGYHNRLDVAVDGAEPP